MQLITLGLVALRGAGSADDGIRTLDGPSKAAALLAYLSACQGQCCPRDQAVELLWADLSQADGRHALRQCRWYLRARTGLVLTSTARQVLVLESVLKSDRQCFLDAFSDGDHREAVQRYTGDFFPDFDAPGASGFAHWADRERYRLRSLFLASVGEATGRLIRDGQTRDAIALARRGRDLAPTEQSAWLHLGEVLLSAGDVREARWTVEGLVRDLTAADLLPDPEAEAFLARLRDSTSSKPAQSESRPVGLRLADGALVGRVRELSRLRTAREASVAGEFSWLHLAAPAGFGKSRLLSVFAATATASRERRSRTVTLSAIESERFIPYALLSQLVAALSRLRGASAVSPSVTGTLVAICPQAATIYAAPPDPALGDEATRRRISALHELLLAVSDEAPITILLDDTHWMDAASAAVLRAALDRLEKCALLVVTAGRPGDRLGAQIARDRWIDLEPLTTQLVVEWLNSVAILPPTDWSMALAATLAAVSHGSPLEIALRIESALDSDVLRIVDGHWVSTDATAVFDHVSDSEVLQRRLVNLESHAAECLLQIAVLGTSTDVGTIQRMLNRDVGASLQLLEASLLVSHVSDSVRIGHAEFGRVLLEISSPESVQAAHRRAAHFFLDAASESHVHRLRAVWHASAAGDALLRDRCFARLVDRAQVHGDRAQLEGLAIEALGPESDAQLRRQLIARLPAALRRSTRHRLAMLAVVLGVALGTSILSRLHSGPSRVVQLTTVAVGADGVEHTVSADVHLHTNDFSPIAVFEAAHQFPNADSGTFVNVAGRFGDGAVLLRQISADATQSMDIYLRDRSGATRPFAVGPFDQAIPQISPDETLVAYIDRSFDPLQNAEIMIRSRTAQLPVRMTWTPAHEAGVVWHRSSDSLAFFRMHDDQPFSEICRIAIAAPRERCLSLRGRFLVQSLLAWRSDAQLLFSGEERTSGRLALLLLSLDDGALQVLDSSASHYSADPSGSLVLCDCRVRGHDIATPSILHVDAPEQPRPLYFRGDRLRHLVMAPVFWSSRDDLLDSIFIKGTDTATVGSTIQLHVVGIAGNGHEAPIMRRRWWSLDPKTATVDSTGRVHPRQQGTARIVVEAEGGLRDSLVLSVGTPTATLQLDEQWNAGDGAWLAFGTPVPRVASTLSALRINGDRVYSSGVISRRSFSARGGLGLQVRFRLPITRSKWQRLSIALDYVASSEELSAWTARIAGILSPRWVDRESRHCTLRLPRGEGGPLRGLVGIEAGTESVALDRLPPGFGDGQWHTADIHVSSDGVCTVRVDNISIGASLRPLYVDRPFRVLLQGASEDTEVLVGPVSVWTGTLQTP